MNIENIVDLAKYAINYIIIIIIRCYQITNSKTSYLIIINIRDSFLISWCLANNLDTR